MLFFSFIRPVKLSFSCALVFWAITSSANAACLLADGPPNTLVPDGYHYSEAGQWKHCKKGAWSDKGPVTKDRPYTPNETGVCLPLENQFTKKNGMISMNFVSEKTRKIFYGFEHECVASTWWRVPGGTKVSGNSKKEPAAPPVSEKTNKKDPLAELEGFYNSTPEPAAKPESIAPAPPAPSSVEVPSFSAGNSIEIPRVKPSPGLTPPPPAAPDQTISKVNPAPGFKKPPAQHQIKDDYKACQINCRRGKDERLRHAENQCKMELRKRYGKGQWSARAEKDFNRCRILAARRENNQLRSCLLPCKKQAGHNVWMGP